VAQSHPNNLYAFFVIPSLIMTAIWLYSGQEFNQRQQANQEAQSNLNSQNKEAQTAESRLQSPTGCFEMMSDRPITTNGSAYYSTVQNGKVVIDRKRPLPDQACIYDRFGNTAIVQWDANGVPRITEIARISVSRMKEILSSPSK